MKIYWICSYPKSGNTWLRNILAGSVFKNAPNFDVHAHDFSIAEQESEIIFLKSHYPWPVTDSIQKRLSHKQLTSDIEEIKNKTAGYIYIYRNPLDVLVSALAFLARDKFASKTEKWSKNLPIHKGLADLGESELQEIINVFMDGGKIPAFTKSGFGSWSENVASWIDAAEHENIIIVKYEDMLMEPIEPIIQLAKFCNIKSLTPAEVKAIADENSLESIRERTPPGYRWFFRKGQIGDFRSYFADYEIMEFYKRNNKLLDKLGKDYSSLYCAN